MGELLKMFKGVGVDGHNKEALAATGPNITRAAEDAGLSDRQCKTPLSVAKVPAGVFDAVVESEAPPTVTQLAVTAI